MTDAVLVRLEALNLKLPDAPAPVANYVPYLISGDLLFISGQVSKAPDGSIVAGRLGADLTVEQVALLLGYSESSTFNRAFKRWAGCTPAEYRARSRRLR